MAERPIPIALRDVSYGKVRRKIVDVLFFEPMDDDRLVVEAQTTIQDFAAKYGDARAICVFFWRNREDVGKKKAAAAVDFAPHGRWEDAHLAEPGDYALHSFHVSYNETSGE